MLNIYRHFSLPALDTRRFKSQSVPTSPIHHQHSHNHHRPITRQQSSPSPTQTPQQRQQSPIPERREPPTTPPSTPTNPMPNPMDGPVFTVGGAVTLSDNLRRSPHDVDGRDDEEEEEEEVDAPTKRNR